MATCTTTKKWFMLRGPQKMHFPAKTQFRKCDTIAILSLTRCQTSKITKFGKLHRYKRKSTEYSYQTLFYFCGIHFSSPNKSNLFNNYILYNVLYRF